MKARKTKSAARRKESQKGSAASRPSLSSGKLWCFRIMLFAGVPLVFLLTVELGLRLGGFGYDTGFFQSSRRDGHTTFVQNNKFGWRFFSAAMARIPNAFCLPQVKQPDTIRIIVLGESAALGDPQPRFGLPRMLQAMLELRYPATHFEVVNAGMTAINSHVILPIARDGAGVGADIVVVYMGNNEVVGPFGAGTVFGRQVPPLGLIRASLALKTTRIGQLIDEVRQRIQKPPADKSLWGGMEMFLGQQVPASDSRMQAVYDHFTRNLSDIISAGRRGGAGVVVSTVAVNLRDCAPFGSAHKQGLNDAYRDRWESFFKKGIAAQAAGRIEEAAESYQEAAKIDGDYAELRFRQGDCALALGKIADAQNEFAAARDLDTLRFRCDSRLNDLIRQTVSNDGDRQVILADAEHSFAEQSPNGLPGDDLFYEHVHLNFHGNYFLARTLAPKVESLLAGKVSASQPWPTESDCARRLGWSDWDKQEALAEIYSRLNKAPFTSQINHAAEMQNLKLQLDKLIPATQPEGIKTAQSLLKNALASAPNDPVLLEQLATLEQSSGDLMEAAANAQRAANLIPSSSEYWFQLGIIQAKQKNFDSAAVAFRRAFEINPEEVWALQNLAQSLKDLGRRDEAIREYRHALAVNPRFGMAWLGLGQVVETLGRKTEAEEDYQKALANRINRAPELITLARFCESRGWHEAAATNYDDAIKLSPSDAILYLQAGQNFAAIGRYAEAEQHYFEATKLAPDSGTAHFLYGVELGRKGNSSGAVEEFRQAVRIMPDLAEARLNLGIALENEGSHAEALTQFNKVLEQNPTNALALNYAQAIRQKISTQPR